MGRSYHAIGGSTSSANATAGQTLVTAVVFCGNAVEVQLEKGKVVRAVSKGIGFLFLERINPETLISK